MATAFDAPEALRILDDDALELAVGGHAGHSHTKKKKKKKKKHHH